MSDLRAKSSEQRLEVLNRVRVLVLVLIFIPCSQPKLQAQISLDGSLGPAGPLSGPDYRIDADLGRLKGENLFQSFDKFNIRSGESATFTGPDLIENIISRITGGDPSSIDGLLRSEIMDADLFLLNPAGVMFGPGATLDVKGSFHVSTADYLRFADKAKFFVGQGEVSSLSVAPPEAFGFLGEPSAGIWVRGSELSLSKGKTLSLVGGDVTISGRPDESDEHRTIAIPDGRLNLLGVASPGEVSITGTELTEEPLPIGGTVHVAEGAHLSVSGEVGGQVFIRGGEFVMENQAVLESVSIQEQADGQASPRVDIRASTVTLSDASKIDSKGWLLGAGGDVRLETDSLLLEDGSSINASTLGAGQAGVVAVNANRILLTGGAEIASDTSGAGTGGIVTITANESMVMTGSDAGDTPSGVFANSLQPDSGDAGQISLSTPHLEMQGGSIQAATAGKGNGGDVNLNANQLILDQRAGIDSFTLGPGNAGDVEISAERVSLAGGAQIDGSTAGTGRAGTLTITATDSIAISGEKSGLVASSLGEESGNAGSVSVSTGILNVSGGGEISTSTSGAGAGGIVTVVAQDSVSIAGDSSGISASSLGDESGNAGKISVSTSSLDMSDGSILAFTLGQGGAGDVEVEADRISLAADAWIDVSTFGERESGDAGNISLSTGSLTLSQDALISAATFGTGRGGAINLKAENSVVISDSSLFSDSLGDGGAGSVSISTGTLTLEDSLISVGTSGKGRDESESSDRAGTGGSVTITARDSVVIRDSTVFSDSFGDADAGNISLSARTLSVEGGFISTGTSGTGKGGALTIKAEDSVAIVDGIVFSNSFGDGDAGDVKVGADRISLAVGGRIASGTSGTGKGGTVTITAKDSVLISGRDAGGNWSGISANSRKPEGEGRQPPRARQGDAGTIPLGDAGKIFLSAPHLQMKGGRIQVVAEGAGNAGDVQIKTDQLTLSRGARIESWTNGSGHAGDVEVNAKLMSLAAGAEIASDSFGNGDAGSIFLSADTLAISESSVTSESRGDGDAGSISLSTGTLRLIDSGEVSTDTFGIGTGGTVTIMADHVSLAAGAQIGSGTFGTGTGGAITITAKKSMLISSTDADNPSGVFANTHQEEAGGDAGQIFLSTPELEMQGGWIQVAGGGGNGGKVTLHTDQLTLGQGARIESWTDGSGNAGDVEVSAERISMSGESWILSSTFGAGRGGSITIRGDDSIAIADSALFTDTFGAGAAGTITIMAEDSIDIANSSMYSDSRGDGDAGSISLSAGNVSLSEASAISADTFGAGAGGRITISAEDSIAIADSALFTDTFGGNGDAGSISLSASTVSLSKGSAISAETSGLGGTITIMAEDSIAIADSTLSGSSFGDGDAGSIALSASTVSLSKGSAILAETFGLGGRITIMAEDSIAIADSGLFSDSFGQGDAGSIALSAGTVSFSGSSISAETFDAGAGGTITIMAEDSIAIADSCVSSDSLGVGKAGGISVTTGNLSLTDGGVVSAGTSGSGSGGPIRINAENSVDIVDSAISSTSSGFGNAGSISVSAGTLNLAEGGNISTDTFGQGSSGIVRIKADSVAIADVDSGLFSRSGERSAGVAGTIEVFAKHLSLVDGARISTSSSGPGTGGSVTVNATDTISISGRGADSNPTGIVSNSTGTGLAGSVQLAADHLSLTDGGVIQAQSEMGNAGQIRIDLRGNFISREGFVSTKAEGIFGGGGQIELEAGSTVQLMGGSRITTSVRSGVLDAGNVTINPGFLVLGNSEIRANAHQGKGGNINISADAFLASPLSVVDASSDRGIDGLVDIRAPVQQLSANVTPLRVQFAQADLLGSRCAATQLEQSSLMTAGAPLPIWDPEQWLWEPVYLDGPVTPPDKSGAWHDEPTPARRSSLRRKPFFGSVLSVHVPPGGGCPQRKPTK